MQKGFTPILILVGILVIALVGTGAYYLGTKKAENQPQNPVQTQVVTSQTPQPSPSPSSTPEKFTQGFYDQYLTCLNTLNSSATDCLNQMKDEISGDLAINFQTELNHGHLLCGAQSPPQKVTVDKATNINNRTTVIVHTIYQYDGDIPLNVELKSINGQWKLTSIICPVTH